MGLATALSLALVACTPPPDWTSPEYIGSQIVKGDERAFAELSRLTPEQQKSVAPRLIEAYNAGVLPNRAIESLVPLADPTAKAAFEAALTKSDDMLASLAARGLAELNDTASAPAIAKRLGEVTTDEAFAGFFEALEKLPSQQAADGLAAVMMRPAAKLGGAGRVRSGCRALAASPSPSDAVLDALVFSTVNFTPQPFNDPFADCELALLKFKEASIPKLVEVFKGNNQKVNDHLKELKYPVVTGQLRAAAALAHSRAASAALTEYVSAPRPVPRAELASMSIEDQQNYFSNSGQLFDMVVKGLAWAGGEANVATIRRLESTGEGSLLVNFEDWFGLSAGAEVGLRQSVHEALSIVGNDDDRKLLWQRAEAGTVGRGGDNSNGLLRTNVLHFLGRTARPGEMAAFDKVLAAQTRFRSSFTPLRLYFALADKCQADVACLSGALKDPVATLNDPALKAIVDAVTDAAEKAPFTNAATTNVRVGSIWQLGLRIGGDAGVGALLDNLGDGNIDSRIDIGSVLLYAAKFPADAGTKLDAGIAVDAGKSGVQGLKQARDAYRLVRATRL
jgi:hypothetical protein